MQSKCHCGCGAQGGQQQDSQELLVTLLAALQAEEDAVIAFRARAAAATAAVENTAAAAATTAPQDPSGPAASTIPIGPDDAQSGGTGAADTAQCPRPAQSTIAALFEGALTSTIVCGSCSHTSTTVEPFTCDVFLLQIDSCHFSDALVEFPRQCTNPHLVLRNSCSAIPSPCNVQQMV